MRLTMAARLWCGYGVIFLVLAVGSFFTIETIKDTKFRATAFTSEDMHFSLVAADMKLQAIQVQQWLTDVSATHDKAGYADSDEAMKNFNNGLEEFKAFYKRKNNTKGLQDLDKLDKAIKQLNADGHLMAETYLGKGLEAGNELMEIFDASSQTMAEALDPFIALQRAAAENSGKILNEDLTFIHNLQFILLGLIILVGSIASFIVIAGLKRQLGAEPEDVADVARKISSGDLDFEMKQLGFSGKSIYAAMFEMRKQLKASFAEANACSLSAVEQADAAQVAIEEARVARVAADNAKREGVLQATSSLELVVKGLSDSSQQLSSRMDVVVAGSNEQVMRVSHASQAMNEMRSTIRDIAHSASSAAITADNAKRKALDGSGAVKEVISEISNAQSQTLRLKDDMAELGKQAQGIGQVLGVISDIADQTNLLALNAAIEAARAGDAGRGFAVVADEVRKLAEKTMVATHEVEKVISNLQSGTTRNIDTVEKTVLIIQSATEKADNSGQALISIVELVDDTSGQVSAMAAASEEQGVASEQISNSLEEITHITDAAKIALSEASASYEELVKNTNAIRKVMTEMEASV